MIGHEYGRSIAGSLEVVIRSLLKDENQTRSVLSIEVIGEDDRELVETWNSVVPVMEQSTLHGLVEEQARMNPQAIATSGFDGDYTYSQLMAMADKLAAHLTAHGVRREVRVVLCFAKSTWPIVSMLAVLKAGGTCCSINPHHPIGRQLGIYKDVGAAVMLCDPQSALRFETHIAQVITVDGGFLARLETPMNWSPPVVQPTDGAFVVYTSGSTGMPKGCVLEHHSVVKSQLVNAQAMNIGPSTRVLQFATYTFDVSVCEIFAPLVKGGCVCVISDDERDSDLPATVEARRANWAMLTTTTAQLLSPPEVPSLKTLVLTGEPLTQEVIRTWEGQVRLISMYGPAECANTGVINVDVTASDHMNIGRPDGYRIWITELKNPHRLVPIGCVGELVAEGPMMGRGYINRPETTAAAFVTDLAWSDDAARRFYRTGDLAKYNPDGTLTCIGRADFQVKINGQRVELGEIQHQIAKLLPDGCEVVVDFASFDGGLEKRLVAFIKLADTRPENADASKFAMKSNESAHFRDIIRDLEHSLSAELPQYMLPSTYIPITRVPMTPSAKTDRRLLRSLTQELTADATFTRGSDSSKRGPTNDMERHLQAVWAQLLQRSAGDIGIDDGFMTLGGDSITAMRAAAACRKMGISMPVSAILRKKTIALIAPHCSRLSGLPTGHVPIPTPEGSGEYVGLGLLSERHMAQLVFQSASEIERVAPLSSFQTLWVQGNLATPQRHWMYFYIDIPHSADINKLRHACSHVVQHHSLLRTVFVAGRHGDDDFLQVTLKTLRPEIDLHESQEDMTVTMERIFLATLEEPVVLGKSFLSFKIIRTATSARLLMRLSHAQFDGLSWTPFVRDLAAAYGDQPLPDPIEYSSFLRHTESQRATSAQYWRSLLDGAEPTSVVHVTTPPRYTDKGVMHAEQTVPPFKALEGLTPATVFNAAVALLLLRQSRTGSEDVTFGRLTSGRAGLGAEYQNLIGPCLNLLPVRIRFQTQRESSASLLLSGDGDGDGDVLQSVHRQYIDAIPHETMALDDIIRDCTNWQTSFTRFPVITQYLSHEEGTEAEGAGGEKFRIGVWDPETVNPFPWSLCLGAFPGREGVRVVATASSGYVDRAALEEIVEGLIAVIDRLTV